MVPFLTQEGKPLSVSLCMVIHNIIFIFSPRWSPSPNPGRQECDPGVSQYYFVSLSQLLDFTGVCFSLLLTMCVVGKNSLCPSPPCPFCVSNSMRYAVWSEALQPALSFARLTSTPLKGRTQQAVKMLESAEPDDPLKQDKGAWVCFVWRALLLYLNLWPQILAVRGRWGGGGAGRRLVGKCLVKVRSLLNVLWKQSVWPSSQCVCLIVATSC